ncbi:hypothetical protein KC360_g3401 [Hortaea werneckii]|nr:hypothetical protein KC325_g3303 [Hortaea werneckii]KAI6995201.1 hypothetical protein KC359_g4199 [Hortaea werneckii]KAI7147108.1 hypothetical protein KC344_g3092 [Hortaea werneckii]KAI7175796.1 hypothetical protein KC360_g3401 [Hortaea werneckii]
MAPMEPSNVDFINLKQDLNDLKIALERKQQASGGRKGVRRSASGVTVEDAEERVQEDIDKIVQSPLHKSKPQGYGGLRMESVQPLRQFHAALLRVKEADEENEEGANAELEARLRALIFSIKPDHPFLTRHEKGNTTEQPSQAPPQMQKTEKAMGKQPAGDKAAVETNDPAVGLGQSNRLAGLSPQRKALADTVKDLSGNDNAGDESDDGTGGDTAV